MKGLSDSDLYKLMSRISLTEAAALTAGLPPSRVSDNDGYGNYMPYYVHVVEGDPKNAEHVFEVTLNALERAVKFGDIAAIAVVNDSAYTGVVYNHENTPERTDCLLRHLNPSETTVERDELKKWFLRHGVKPEAFFPSTETEPYLNQNHYCYAPKLAVLVQAWIHVTNHGVPTGSTFKQAIQAYLKEHGHKHTKDGKPLTGDLPELAAIANWDGKGEKAKYLGDLLGVDQEVFEATLTNQEYVSKKQSINLDLKVSDNDLSQLCKERHSPYELSKNSNIDNDLPF